MCADRPGPTRTLYTTSTRLPHMFSENRIKFGHFKPILYPSKVAIFDTSCANFLAAMF